MAVNGLENKAWPDCVGYCKVVKELGVGECESVCPEKFPSKRVDSSSPPTEKSAIVAAAETYYSYGRPDINYFYDGQPLRFLAFARVIVAEIGKCVKHDPERMRKATEWREKIEHLMQVRKDDADATRGRTEDLEHKVSDIPALWENDEQKDRKITILERKVESLELNQTELIKDAVRPKSQPVYAKDEKGERHRLIKGRSVIKSKGNRIQSIFHHRDEACGQDWGNMVYTATSEIDRDLTWHESEGTIWLFDLPAPGGDA